MAGSEFHVTFPRMKHEENSPQGDLEAIHRGFSGTDHDEQKGLSGISYNTHWKDIWNRDGFRDPLHEYGPNTKHGPVHFNQLPDVVIQRVVAHGERNGRQITYKIRSTVAGIHHAAKVGLEYVQTEAKPYNDWTTADFRRWKAAGKDAGIRVVVKTLDNWPGWRRTLWRARLAGLKTLRIRA